MFTSIATVSISGTYEEKVAAIAKAGFDGIEIFENDLLMFPGSPRDAGQMARDAGLEITLFQPFRDFEGLPDPARQRAFDRAKAKFDLMMQLETDLILICSSVAPEGLGGIDRAAADLRELGDIARDRGLRVGYEALAWGRHVNDHRDAWEIVRRADHPNVGLILDSFHTLSRGIPVDSIRAIPGDKIFIVQLADAPKFTMDALYWSRHFRNMPGQGELPVIDFMRAIRATGYNGAWSLEIFNDQFRSADPALTARDGHRSLIAAMDEVSRPAPHSSGPASAIPPRSAPSEISFIEFTAKGRDAESLRGTLSVMGFQKSGNHLSKRVELWRQGDIKIVINTDPVGHARHAFDAHGVSVCDMGLHVADAEAASSRAAHMLVPPFSQPADARQLNIPAVHGVGDSVIHFLDDSLADVWSVEFGVPSSDPSPSGAGLTAIDHIAQTMPYEEILSWTLFYTSIFDMAQAPMIDIVDPGGLVRSQAICTPDRSVAFTLNGADDRRTFAGDFAQRSGPAVQHIAFTCEDIFSTADKLRAAGFQTLEIPGNYFDDLRARFGLDDQRIAELRAANILFDRDHDGEFFQLYGQAWDNGFFFEIVERRGGYAGFGAANAIFRVAAQKRGRQAA